MTLRAPGSWGPPGVGGGCAIPGGGGGPGPKSVGGCRGGGSELMLEGERGGDWGSCCTASGVADRGGVGSGAAGSDSAGTG